MNAFQKLKSLGEDFDTYYVGKNEPIALLKAPLRACYVYRSHKRWLPFSIWAFLTCLSIVSKEKISTVITPWGSTEVLLGFFTKILFVRWIVLFWDDPAKVLFFYNGSKLSIGYIRRYMAVNVSTKLLRFANLIISNVVPDVLINKYKVPKEKVAFVTNGIDLSIQYPLPDKRNTSSPPSIFLTCPLRKDKLEDFFYALSDLKTNGYQFNASVIGFLHDKDDQLWIESTLQELEILSEVEITYGPIPHSDLLKTLVNSDICVFPYRKGYDMNYIYPVKIFEYMVAGKPIVATDLKGVKEIVGDSCAAILVEPNNPNEISLALQRLIDDPVLRQKMAESGKTRVKAFDWERINAKVNLAIEHAASK